MNISFKIGMYSLAIASSLFFIGCGGGGDTSTVDIGGGKDVVSVGNFKYNRVSIAGSSITWGGAGQDGGYLGEKSYVGEVEKYLRESVADTIGADELKNGETINEPFSYQGKLKRLPSGTTIEGNLPKASDEIIIVYGGSDAVVEMEVDGKVCGTHTISGTFKPVKILNPENEKDGVGQIRSFRETDERAVNVICKNLENKGHKFKLTVKSGELHLNFITNHMYYFQNAGIGGYKAADLLSEKARVKNTTTDQIVAFNPDLFILESATNDAQPWFSENSLSTNDWILEGAEPFSVDGNKITLQNGVNVNKGDVVIIGEYNGDMKNMVVGVIASNSNSQTITLSKIVSYANAVATEVSTIPSDIVKKCRIKSIKEWEDNVKEVIKRVTSGSTNKVVVGIGTSGVPNYYNPFIHDAYKGASRRLLGYREKGQILASENGWMFYDFFQKTLTVNSGVDVGHNDINDNWVPSKWSVGDNTHPKAEGYSVFGSAITDKI